MIASLYHSGSPLAASRSTSGCAEETCLAMPFANWVRWNCDQTFCLGQPRRLVVWGPQGPGPLCEMLIGNCFVPPIAAQHRRQVAGVTRGSVVRVILLARLGGQHDGGVAGNEPFALVESAGAAAAVARMFA